MLDDNAVQRWQGFRLYRGTATVTKGALGGFLKTHNIPATSKMLSAADARPPMRLQLISDASNENPTNIFSLLFPAISFSRFLSLRRPYHVHSFNGKSVAASFWLHPWNVR